MPFKVIGAIIIEFAVLMPLSAATCFGCSSASHAADSWCHTVQCADVYVNAGFCKCGGDDTTTQAISTMAPVQTTTSTAGPVRPGSTARPIQPGSPSVIFRLDGVQDFFLSQHAKQIIEAFINRQQRLSIGVIGGNHFGQDASIVQTVTEAVNQHNSEVFNHGDDAITLFDRTTKEEAKQHILAAEEAGFIYSTFVPRENRWNQALVEALQELGRYTVLSASTLNMPVDLASSPKEMPQAAQTAIFSGGWQRDVQNVVSKCQQQFSSVPVCVVMMHPQEFRDGAVTINDLENLIDEVVQQGWSITTFCDFASSASSTLPATTTAAASTSKTMVSSTTVTSTTTAAPSTSKTMVSTSLLSTTSAMEPSTTEQNGSCTGCCGVAPWNTPNMDAWCQGNCAQGNCPASHCSDECRTRRLASSVWV